MFELKGLLIITQIMLVTAVLLINGCEGAPKSEADFEAVRAEILAIETQWATAIERQDAAMATGRSIIRGTRRRGGQPLTAFAGRTCTCDEMGDNKQSRNN